ncbi:MAG TPA: AsmA family protein [Solimonas sp.]|nr:AsmA family protein [Solimonas sp.]
MPATRPRHRNIVLAAAVIVLVALLLLWDWNWFRPLVERQASSALDRKVTLQRFDIDLGRHPLLIGEGIVIANPPEFPQDSRFGSVDRLAVRIDPWPLLRGQLRLLELSADRPLGDLRPGPSGKPNWKFADDGDQDQGEPGMPVEIGRLDIREGRIHILEPRYKADFVLDLRTEAAPDGEPRLRVDINGTYAGEPITGRFIGGSLLSLREPDQPYPVDLDIANGPTQVTLKGTVQRPLQLGGANLDLSLRGNDLAALYPLTGVPTPPTAAYQLKGKLDYAGQRVRFHKFSGTVGQSDLSGNLEIDLSRKKRLIRAHLVSEKVVLADLAGIVGATPGEAGARGDTAKQQRQRAAEERSGRLLPDRPINLPRIRAADLDVHYKGKRIESAQTPVDNLETHVIVKDGFMSLKPLRFGVGEGGQIASNIEIDGRKDLVHAVADVDFRRIDLKRLMQETKVFEGTGLIGGTARIDGRGNSMAAVFGSGNGELKLFMNGGQFSALLVNLAGLEFGKALLSAIGLPSETKIRCMVSDFELKKGQLDTRMLLLDTGEANVIGDGTINLRDETLDYRIHTKPKRFGLGSLRAPIHVDGSFKNPKIRPDWERLAVRGGTAVVLGVFLTPLAALIPTVELGLGENNDCKALVDNVRAEAANLPKETSAVPAAKKP